MDQLEIKPIYGNKNDSIQVAIYDDGDRSIIIRSGKFVMATAYISQAEWEQIKEFWK